MKKTKLLILPLFLAFTLTGCSLLSSVIPTESSEEQQSSDNHSSEKDTSSTSSEHKHTFSREWTYDENTHWHEATCGHDVKGNEAPHSMIVINANDNGFLVEECSVCEYQRRTAHTFSDEWSSNGTHHWHACTDEGYEYLKAGYAEHTLTVTDENDNGYLVETCSICGYVKRTKHNFSRTWSHDETHHWHACTDSGYEHLKSNYSEHQFVVKNENDDGYLVEKCSVCSYERRTEHRFSDVWSFDATHHWHACLDEGYEHIKKDYEEHDFDDEIEGGYVLHTCKVCGHSYQEIYVESPIVSSYEMKTYTSTSDYVTTTVYYMNGKTEVPYVVFNDFYVTHYVDKLWGSGNRSYFALNQTKTSDGVYSFSGYCGELIIDTTNDTISLPDGEDFQMMIAANTDASGAAYIADGYEPYYCQVASSETYNARQPIFFDLGDYSIDLISYDDIVYMPLVTFTDIFLSGNGSSYTFNGKDLYKSSGFGDSRWGNLDDSNSLEYQYFTDSPWYNESTRDSYLAQFTYNELCFALDNYYGLKEFRGVNSFNDFFTTNSYKDKLLSTNSDTYERGMVEFVGKWLYEGHSGYTKVSPFKAGTNYNSVLSNGYSYNTKYQNLVSANTDLKNKRNSAGKGVGLTFSGNTAIITFDSFKKGYNMASTDVSSYSYSTLHANCTNLFFKKAFSDIKSHGGINNVVIDITCNGGGMVDALPWLEAYMTSDPFILMETSITGEIAKIHYSVDLNCDGTFGGAGDTYAGQYNFFLLTSNFSFSCGNAFPTFVKMGHMATIIGETSGGGACAVGVLSTASGTILRMSSMFRFGYFNGSGNFVLNEDGITPDYTFSRSNFYNDSAINTFVNSL